MNRQRRVQHESMERSYTLPARALGAILRRRFETAQGSPSSRSGGGEILLGQVDLAEGVQLMSCGGARIVIGDGAHLARNTLVHAREAVYVGAEARIAWDVIIADTQGAFGLPTAGVVRPVHVGDRVWIGAGAVILGGVTIGDDAVIGAGAIVTGPVQPGEIVRGRPGALDDVLDPQRIVDV